MCPVSTETNSMVLVITQSTLQNHIVMSNLDLTRKVEDDVAEERKQKKHIKTSIWK